MYSLMLSVTVHAGMVNWHFFDSCFRQILWKSTFKACCLIASIGQAYWHLCFQKALLFTQHWRTNHLLDQANILDLLKNVNLNQATGHASQHIWCLSQARINWQGCSRKASGIEIATQEYTKTPFQAKNSTFFLGRGLVPSPGVMGTLLLGAPTKPCGCTPACHQNSSQIYAYGHKLIFRGSTSLYTTWFTAGVQSASLIMTSLMTS